MILMWVFFLVTGSVPEFETEPIRITMHILAEVLTAILLIISGIGIIKQKSWAKMLTLLSLGMLIYTLIQSPGYFMETGEYIIVVMFAIMLLFAAYFAIKTIFNKKS